ncbi:MAG TPA: aquaporin [Patescibacteria group bacterium]|nr:aquaporin [Patescibacteria group bacterium]
MFGREKIAIIIGEFLGVAVLTSSILAMTGRTDFPFFSAIAAGLAMGLMTILLAPHSGGHINPAVTIGLWTLKKVETTVAVVMIAAQMLGGLAAWRLNEYFLNTKLSDTAGKTFNWRVFVAEAVGTFVFTWGVAAAVSRKYEAGMKAVVVGGSLLLGILVASFASNGILNPAVAAGVRSWSWAYATAPIVGSIVGMNLYTMVFEAAPAKSKNRGSRKK